MARQKRRENESLAEAPLDALSREQKILLLKRLRSKLCNLVAALTAKQSGAPITQVASSHTLYTNCAGAAAMTHALAHAHANVVNTPILSTIVQETRVSQTTEPF